MLRPIEPEEARAFLDYMVELGLLEKHAEPGGGECYSFTAPLAPPGPPPPVRSAQ
ncbi:MAG: hypothetical protein LC623_04895 [Halobacteriales archaeon]|nr:hypothetical protein [Halobacteriales archaeon]